MSRNTFVFSTNLKNFLLVLLFLAMVSGSLSWGATKEEQSKFNADELVKRPVPVPDNILDILLRDSTVAGCINDNPILHRPSLGSWFVASEIHLDGDNEADMVVLPIAQGEACLCFHSAEGISWFWVFRPVGRGYELALKAAGLELLVLNTKHNGYRDIRIGGQVGKFGTKVVFRFAHGLYRQYRKREIELH